MYFCFDLASFSNSSSFIPALHSAYFLSSVFHSITYLFKYSSLPLYETSQGKLVVKNPPANAGDKRDRDVGLIPGSGRSSGGGNCNPLQYPCLENPMDKGAWWATLHGVAQSQTQLK